MKRWGKRCVAFLLLFTLTVSLVRGESRAVLDGVYFSAVNDRLLDMEEEAMPFYSGGKLYISSRFFESKDLDVLYVRNRSMGLAVLYTTQTDLRFDLVNQRVYDERGVYYDGRAIEKNGIIFFPVDLVCRYFGLSYSVMETTTVPLIRVKSNSVLLSDFRFLDAVINRLATRYAAYEKAVKAEEEPAVEDTPPVEDKNHPSQSDPPTTEDPPKEDKTPSTEDPPVIDEPELPTVHAREGQKVYLILASSTAEHTRTALAQLGESKATFLMDVVQMEDGDLLRAVLGQGHEIALILRGESEAAREEELRRARELLWNAACSPLRLVWYEGEDEVTALLTAQGCVAVTAVLDRRDTPVQSQNRAETLLTVVGRYYDDVSIYLGTEQSCREGLDSLLSYLREAEYRLCAWRLTTS